VVANKRKTLNAYRFHNDNQGITMVEVKERIADISKHLQTLTSEEYSQKIEKAVQKQDKNSLIKLCRQAKIPSLYIPSIVSVIMSVSPQKWPDLA
jgi:uncharacterized protein YydD (DUF2326 family)